METWVTDKKFYTDIFIERENYDLQIGLIFNYSTSMLTGLKLNTATVDNTNLFYLLIPAFFKFHKLLMKTQKIVIYTNSESTVPAVNVCRKIIRC